MSNSKTVETLLEIVCEFESKYGDVIISPVSNIRVQHGGEVGYFYYLTVNSTDRGILFVPLNKKNSVCEVKKLVEKRMELVNKKI